MPARRVHDQDLLAALKTTRSTTKLASMFGVTTRAIIYRLRELGVPPAGNHVVAAQPPMPTSLMHAQGRVKTDITDGRVVVFSDAHFQPDAISTANRALLKLLPDLKPCVVVCNGDAVDGATTSRHAPMFGERPPSAMQELRASQQRLDDIADAAGTARLIYTIGNHDIRLHAYLATSAPQLADLPAVDLRVLFPRWDVCWSFWLNDNTIIKHRYRSGQYAPANNVRGALGMSFVTGHLHSMKCIPLSSYAHKATAYGIDTGMLADPEWAAFAYREDNPADWRSGFVVLTWARGRLLWPEFVAVVEEGLVEFRGQLIEA